MFSTHSLSLTQRERERETRKRGEKNNAFRDASERDGEIEVVASAIR